LTKTLLKLLAIGLIINSYSISQPKFYSVDGIQINFGDVPNFTPTKHTLVIKNIGTDTLILSEVGTSCGCTATLLSKDHLLANDSALLYITFDAKKFNGHVEKMVSMVTNDEANRSVEIRFTANVVKIFELDPDYFYIRAAKGIPVSHTLKLKNVGMENIKILSVTSSTDLVKPMISQSVIKPNEDAILTVTFQSKSLGTTNANIDIKTDNRLAQLISIRFFGITVE